MKIQWKGRQPRTSTHHIDTTPGDTFGGLGTDGLTEYREEEIVDRGMYASHPNTLASVDGGR
jgi:hypothetical protein